MIVVVLVLAFIVTFQVDEGKCTVRDHASAADLRCKGKPVSESWFRE